MQEKRRYDADNDDIAAFRSRLQSMPRPLLSLTLSLGIIFCGIGVAHATAGCNGIGWSTQHQDVHGCDLYYPAIQWLYDRGIVQGVQNPADPSTRNFLPKNEVNRAEFTKMAWLGSGEKEPPPCALSPFPDVPASAWFAPYVCAAKAKGIISGFPDGTFQPGLSINFANASKILAKTFSLPLNLKDANYGNEQIWYRVYTEALRKKNITAPTIGSFAQMLHRNEMAEMIYRLRNGKPSFVMPTAQTDGEPLGMGYTHPFSLETTLGITVTPPDPPYVFAPSQTTVQTSGGTFMLSGFAFSHVLPYERCGESGLFEHCTPLFADWIFSFYTAQKPMSFFEHPTADPVENVTIDGRKGTCEVMGLEGEYTRTCLIAMTSSSTLMMKEDYVDSSVAFADFKDITPLKTIDVMFLRIKTSMRFP